MPPKARACPQCGADERTGWDEEATRYDGLDLPESAFDRDEAGGRKGGPGGKFAPRGIALFWWGTGLCIVFLMTYLVFSGRF